MENEQDEEEGEDEAGEDREDEARESDEWWLQPGRDAVNRLLLQVAESRANVIHIDSGPGNGLFQSTHANQFRVETEKRKEAGCETDWR